MSKFGIRYYPYSDDGLDESTWCTDDTQGDNPILFDTVEQAQQWLNENVRDSVLRTDRYQVEEYNDSQT